MVAASLGQGKRMEYCLLGDNANVGARLEQLGKQHGGEGPRSCTIMISDVTWALLGGAFSGRRVASSCYEIDDHRWERGASMRRLYIRTLR